MKITDLMTSLAALLCLALAPSFASATPLGGSLLNDDFESGLGSWFAEGATGSVAISPDAFAGSGALEVGYAADFQGGRIDLPLAEEDRFAELAIGFVYKAADNSPATPAGIRAALVEFSPSGVTFHNGDFLFADGVWRAGPANVFTLSRPDTDSLSLIIQGHSTPAGGSVLIDNITLTKVGPPIPEPCSATLLAVAAAAAAARRRPRTA